MSEVLADALEDLRALLDSRELTKGVSLRTPPKREADLPWPGGAYRTVLGRRDREIAAHERLLNGSFGLSVKRHTGRWEQAPHSGSLAELVEVICDQLQHLIASW